MAHSLADEQLDDAQYFGTTELRWFQIAARNAAIDAVRNKHKRILIVAPTGSGKTIIFASTVSSPEMKKALGITEDRPLRVLFMSHKHRLLTQAEETFASASGVELMLQSMMSSINPEFVKQGWDICVFDEAHHEKCASAQYHLEKLGEFPLIGITATPDTASGHLIKFDHIINPISREQAVAEGFIAETDINTIVDVSGADKTQLVNDVLSRYGEEMGQTMIFLRTKREIKVVVTHLTQLGKTAVGLMDQSDKEVNQILNDFSAKKIQFLINCNKISEGVDVKGCTDVLLGRQVGSYPLLNQIIGRAARIDDPRCVVWELVNPLSGRNLDTTVVVGTPKSHRLISKENKQWVERFFNYTSTGQSLHSTNHIPSMVR